jgi:hypothetical protein
MILLKLVREILKRNLKYIIDPAEYLIKTSENNINKNVKEKINLLL